MRRPVSVSAMAGPLAAVSLLVMQACAVSPVPEDSGEGGTVAALAGRLAGEYSNHAQAWQAKRGNGPAPDSYQVSIVPAAGSGDGRVLHFRQYRAGKRATPHREARFLLEPGPDGGVTQKVERRVNGDWQPLPGCAIEWRRVASGFEGGTRGDECRFRDPRSGEVVTRHRNWTVDDEGFVWEERRVTAQGEETETLRFKAVEWFTGWAGVRGRGADGRGEGDWRIERRLRLHDGGAVRQLPAVDGSVHAIRLERLQWPNSGIRMLRLGVIEADTGELVAYAWAPPDAEYIGIHLGWLQVGLEVSGGTRDDPPRAPAAIPD